MMNNIYSIPGFDRSVNYSSNFPHHFLLQPYFLHKGIQDDERIGILLALSANHKRDAIAMRETLFLSSRLSLYKNGTSFNGRKVLQSWKDNNIISSFTDYSYKDHKARFLKVSKRFFKNLSDFSFSSCVFLIQNDLQTLLTYLFPLHHTSSFQQHIQNLLLDSHSNSSFFRDSSVSLLTYIKNYLLSSPLTVSSLDTLLNLLFPGFQPQRKKFVLQRLVQHFDLKTSSLSSIKKKYSRLHNWSNNVPYSSILFPLKLSPSSLHNQSVLPTQQNIPLLPTQENIPLLHQSLLPPHQNIPLSVLPTEDNIAFLQQPVSARDGKFEVLHNQEENRPTSILKDARLSNGRMLGVLHNQEGNRGTSILKDARLSNGRMLGIFQDTPTNNPFTTPFPLSSSLPSPFSSPSFPSSLRSLSSCFVSSPVPSTPSLSRVPNLQKVTFTNYKDLRNQALDYINHEIRPSLEVYQDVMQFNLSQYIPRDVIDLRHLENMLLNLDNTIGPLPRTYNQLTLTSPRVYSEDKDNLFYCRKEMRLQAMKGLGLQDMDLRSCHVNIMLGLWPDKLPVLKSLIESNHSIWKYYENIFNQQAVPFYKSLVKSLHHSTFLGGGLKAYQKAINTYNNHNPGQELSQEQSNQIIQVFKSTEVYKELRGLFRYLSLQYKGKNITTITGEHFKVQPFRYKKNTDGSLIQDKGNLLTVISAILQSYEVIILSWVLLRCKNLFLPILWQHDGLTIKSFYSNISSLVQQAADEISIPLIGRSIPFDFSPL